MMPSASKLVVEVPEGVVREGKAERGGAMGIWERWPQDATRKVPVWGWGGVHEKLALNTAGP